MEENKPGESVGYQMATGAKEQSFCVGYLSECCPLELCNAIQGLCKKGR